jgi:hypothetical protein
LEYFGVVALQMVEFERQPRLEVLVERMELTSLDVSKIVELLNFRVIPFVSFAQLNCTLQLLGMSVVACWFCTRLNGEEKSSRSVIK